MTNMMCSFQNSTWRHILVDDGHRIFINIWLVNNNHHKQLQISYTVESNFTGTNSHQRLYANDNATLANKNTCCFMKAFKYMWVNISF